MVVDPAMVVVVVHGFVVPVPGDGVNYNDDGNGNGSIISHLPPG